ncbi:MAG TPA: thioredoxin domain-containing protein [Candidatus Limnocylindrales bacterium]|nr:thioredoxin domain-containing protein [Candidatus Limnocylindrales bacterium]
MPNRLATETSPYLLQHANNPVDWWPWGPDALARAKLTDRPIFLSIGYAACHWCHVMERESFEDEATAAYLNEHFVPIKVDREERPDLDQVYMGAVQAMTGGGGWPMSVFLTPDGKPFYGGTYFPDEPRHGMPSFRQVLEGVRRAYADQRAEVEQAGVRLVSALTEQARTGTGGATPTTSTLDAATAAIEQSFDARNGGWGGAPKFPQPMTIEYLLRRHLATGDPRPLAVARRSLDAMADGGIRDQLGGGFHRYATDAIWLVPHFEQMLYDNAQLARVYVHAWQVTGDEGYRDVAEGTLDYLLRELRTEDGAFAASQDADTNGVEGATFTWTAAEVRDVLGEDAPAFTAAYGVTDDGNWEGVSILSRVLPRGDDEAEARLARARAALLERRRTRPQPARDDKVLAAWNGLAIAALADAGRLPGGGRYVDAAVRAADAVVAGLLADDGRLRRSWKDARATAEGVLEDYADLADGLLALYEATFDARWFGVATGLADQILDRFADPGGGFFDTATDHEPLITRPRDLQDNAVPAGGSMATAVLLRLAALTGDGRYRSAAERALGTVGGFLARYPTAFANWLTAADFALAPVVEIAVVGEPGSAETNRLLAPALERYRPNQVLAVTADPAASVVPLLGGRFALHGRPTAFVCRNFACRQPVDEPEALAALLLEA